MTSRKHGLISPSSLRQAERHLGASCTVMAQLLLAHGRCTLANRKVPPFQTLTRSIIGQQLSFKAAATIERRVLNVVSTFTPAEFLRAPFDDLRGAGLSSAKARYITELAQRVTDGRLDFDVLKHHSNEEVIAALTELPGVGRWTAEMFLIFGLRRTDVLALGDVGLQRAVRLLYGEDAKLEAVAQSWRPFCSVASWYLWRHLDSE